MRSTPVAMSMGDRLPGTPHARVPVFRRAPDHAFGSAPEERWAVTWEALLTAGAAVSGPLEGSPSWLIRS